ncbi:hypothetical protein AA0614_2473 [Komagataeibacter saccharivorans NRIC 0614]|nr:hypothetical protein AA0614_2473 [Komagataeibacter saccharivorans NRIC 0614]
MFNLSFCWTAVWQRIASRQKQQSPPDCDKASSLQGRRLYWTQFFQQTEDGQWDTADKSYGRADIRPARRTYMPTDMKAEN